MRNIPMPGTTITTKRQSANPLVFDFGLNICKSRPIAPVTMACFDENGHIDVSTFVFLPTSFGTGERNFIINQLQVNSNRLSFYIGINESPTPDHSFLTFRITFKAADKDYKSLGINKIETYLWDIDPEGSRGTETHVQDAC
jgi:hypothetical protein